MSSLWTKMMLSAYRRLGSVIYPFMGPFLALRAKKGKEDRERRYERYGYASDDRPNGPVIWLHAASVGESMAILALIDRIQDLGISTIMTTGTVTSAQVVKDRLPKTTMHQFVPLDLKPAVVRFLDHWKPDLAIFTESEIWPTTIEEMAKRNIPQVLINARMSDRSFKRWTNAPKFAEVLFDKFSHVIAQSKIDAERFKHLGARPVSMSGNLKVDTKSLPVDKAELERLRKEIDNRPVWVAASTHKGEEEILLDVHAKLKKEFPNILTIIVPRHPERGDEVEELAVGSGLVVARRGRKENIRSVSDIYLGDTIGEMGLFLRLAAVTFMGRSLASSGGQNPLEPAAIGTAILSGQNVGNFRDTYKSLLDRGGVRLVRDADMLASNIAFLLKTPKERDKMIAAAEATVVELKGALEKTFSILDSYIFPLTVKSKLEDLKDGN